ncbi:MAG: Ig-like domain-containing protein, partial [Nitrospira sp.]|nr:Ig-like domain-containing protein [Nitrospira sp.]
APAPKLRVANIVLTGKTQGSRVTISGLVQIRDGGGAVVRNATVTVQWRLPNGSTPSASARTDSMGRATFSVSGARGTYQLTVTGVTKAGYVFDPAGSVLSKSITK